MHANAMYFVVLNDISVMSVVYEVDIECIVFVSYIHMYAMYAVYLIYT